MAVDPAVALGTAIAPFTTSWDADTVILYHLGIGAGLNKATDPAELAYTYEQKLEVLPSFGVVPAFQALVSAVTGQVPGLAINPIMVLHGEQDLEVHKAIPTSGTSDDDIDYAGRSWQWQQKVTDTKVRGMVKIEVNVRPADSKASDS